MRKTRVRERSNPTKELRAIERERAKEERAKEKKYRLRRKLKRIQLKDS